MPLIVDATGTDYDALVDTLVAQFDAERPDVERIVNDRVRRMAQRAKWRQAVVSVGSTTVDDSTYQLSGSVLDIDVLKVDGETYLRVTAEALDALRHGSLALTEVTGAYAVRGVAGATVQVDIFPTPEEAGLEITAEGAISTLQMSYGSGAALPLPIDVHGYLLSGCRADCYRQFEDRPDMTPPEEAEFEQGVIELRRIRQQRAGLPTRVAVQGFDF